MSIPVSESVPRAEIFFAAKDKALRDDVHRLGGLVGELAKDHPLVLIRFSTADQNQPYTRRLMDAQWPRRTWLS